MRKAQKKQAADFVKLLGQAHEKIREAVGCRKQAAAMELLEQCQDGAIKLGNMIEEEEGEGFITARLLEDYCEAVYRLHEKLRLGLSADASGEYKALEKFLVPVGNSIRDDIRVRLEVVFLPYKASMWDSLESVWKAADEDPDCDAYVIPIPYFDRNPDGSPGELHYEGALFPEYVPVAGYEEYDFTRRRPDAVFIHNPYDEYNYVTSVHPFFYTKNLKRITEWLIYIPYFVLGEIAPDDQAAVEGMKQFCTAQGVINADRVIVQSENMRQIYINVLTEHARNTSLNRKFWEEKILGLGSPKMDKVLNTRKENLEIPEEWLRIIQKPDGSWKRIIFYNTGVAMLLQHDRNMLVKVRDVFRVFKENRDRVALLWRPHPLMEATIKAMRPELWNEYAGLVKQYREEGWGIYDNTADLDRAVEISSAYYGDGSSVVQLFEKKHKPAMIQNVGNIVHEHHRRLRFIDYFDDGENIWFFALYTKGLFRFNKSTGKTRIVCYLPAETLHEAYRALCLKDGKAYLAPFYAKELAVYDLAEQKLEQFPLQFNPGECRTTPSGDTANFGDIYMFQNYIFFVPLSFGAIVRLDIQTNNIEYYNDFVEMLLPVVNNGEEFWFRNSCVVDDKIYLPSCCANALIEFDMRSCTSVMHRPCDEAISYSAICYDGRYFWILGCDGDFVIAWNRQEGLVDKIELDYVGKYNYIFSSGNAVLRVPCCGDLTCDQINLPGRQLVSPIKLQAEASDKWSVSKFFTVNSAALCVKIQDDKLFVFSTQRDSLCVFDKAGRLLHESVFEICEDDYNCFVQSQTERLSSLVEAGGTIILNEDFFDINISCFLEYLTNMNEEADAENRISENHGRRIFENIKMEVLN